MEFIIASILIMDINKMKKETATVKDLLKGGAALFIMVSVILWGVKTFLNIVALAVSKIAQITSNMDAQ